MPPRSAVSKLPDDVREELNRRLVSSQFSDYDGLTEWLAGKGYTIGRASVGRYGKAFEDRIKTLKLVSEQARAVVAEAPDDDNSVNAALIRLAQEKAFNVLIDLDLDPETIEFPKLMRAIADMGRASVQQQRFAAEARKTALAAAAEKVSQVAKKQGVSPEMIQLFRREILGIDDGQPART